MQCSVRCVLPETSTSRCRSTRSGSQGGTAPGSADCGSCTAYSVYDSIELEKASESMPMEITFDDTDFHGTELVASDTGYIVELTGSARPNTRSTARHSILSFSGVPVPCRLR